MVFGSVFIMFMRQFHHALSTEVPTFISYCYIEKNFEIIEFPSIQNPTDCTTMKIKKSVNVQIMQMENKIVTRGENERFLVYNRYR